jgi:hypothetical protein
MKRRHNTRAPGLLIGSLLAVFALSLAPGLAGVQGTVTTKDDRREYSGDIRYRGGASRVYEVTDRTMKAIPVDRVLDVVVPAPPQLTQAIADVRGGKQAQAIGPLSRIVEDYQMLKWDVTAAAWLMRAYVKAGQFKPAAELGQKMMRENMWAQRSDDFAGAFTEALQAGENYPELEQMLGQIVKQGSRAAVARAQIARGDIRMKTGQFKDALIDGYLRTVILFGDIKAVQPEALSKAADCFDRLGQGPYAERMRKILLEQYPQSPYAEKLKSS